MKYILILLFFFILFFYGYPYYKFAKGVAEDSQHSMKTHKQFIKKIEFSGKIFAKKIIQGGDEEIKFRIVVSTEKKIFENTNIGLTCYLPYYQINENGYVEFCVLPTLFNAIKEGDTFIKEEASSKVKINEKTYSIYNESDAKWLP